MPSHASPLSDGDEHGPSRATGRTRPAAPDRPTPVDALIVGGGVQGLSLLRALTDRGYAAALVTDAPLGSGQTLHSHGFVNSGYALPDAALRRSVEEDWLPFLREHGVETYGEERFFGVLPPEVYELLSGAWTENGYPFEDVPAEALPPGFREGLPEDDPVEVVRATEYSVPKRGLVRALSDGLADRVLRGDVTRVGLEAAAGDAAVAVGAVDVETHATGETVTLAPEVLVVAAGIGTQPFVESVVAEPAFERAAGEDAAGLREAVREQLGRITYERVHMICIRGPTDVLPGVTALLANRGLTVASADVDATHDLVGGDRRTWYVTPRTPEPEAVENVPDSARAEPVPATVARGIELLEGAYPPLRDVRDELEFGVYAGYKQNVGESRTGRLCERVAGTADLLVALPSVIGGAWLNAERAVELVEEAVEPGDGEPIAGTGEGVRAGDVVERTDDFEWRSWEAFREQFPDG